MDTEKMLYDIIDRIGSTQDDMREILVAMQVDLKYHIRRTDLLEEEVRILRDEVRPLPWKKIAAAVSVIGGLIGIAIKLNIL